MSGGGTRRWETRDPGVLAWVRLIRVYQQVTRDTAARLRESGLTAAQFDVLAHVGLAEGRPQRELAEALLVTKGNVTQLLERMEQCGYIERHQVGRTKCVSLTASGRALRERAVPAVEAAVMERMRVLSVPEQRELQRLLRSLDRAPGGSD